MQSPFARRLMISGLLVAVGAGMLAPLVLSVSYEPWGVPESLRDEYKRKVRHVNDKIAAANNEDGEYPRLVIDQRRHDFGMMDPLTTGRHAFVVSNQGDKPLILVGGETSCKCTLIEGAKQIIDPGQSAEIALSWNSGRVRDHYEQTALIDTNDPDTPELRLTVAGKVRSEFGISESEIHFPNLEPGGEGTCQLDVFSQLYYDFDIASIEATIDDLVWQMTPLDRPELDRHEARSGYRLRFTLPTRNIDGLVSGVVRLHLPRPERFEEAAPPATQLSEHVPPPEEDDPEWSNDQVIREIPVRGRLPKLISLYGSDLHREHGLEMGTMHSGVKHERKIFLKTRGTAEPEYLRIGNVEPAFIQVSMKPSGGASNTSIISIVVPKDAPTHIFNIPPNTGRIEIESDLAPNGKIILPIVGAVIANR